MMRDLHGRVMLVTGASSGIGAATAIEAGRAGMRVVLAARRKARLEAAAARVREAGGETLVVPTDVTDERQVQRMVERTLEHFGGVDVLFANAGFGWFGEAMTGEEIEREMWETNYFGVERCVRAVLPVMKQQACERGGGGERGGGSERGGHILVCSSIVAHTGLPFYASYAATKAALHALVRSLHLELEPEGIAVTGVYPGGTKTEWFQAVARHSGRDAISENTPAIFMSTAEHVARKVVAAIGRSRPPIEVWPSRLGRLGAMLWVMLPRFWRACFRVHTKQARRTLGEAGGGAKQALDQLPAR